ncbi:phage tail protein [Campylobacter jejuni]|nr:phage tail protein [Campylobacter jejuni]ECO5821581.1 phage tail protein [Campylobacter jejuni]KAJ9870506.1 phage tail protein [Campylobacter jejuni]KAJ9891203.1 phage tail protein [Campylobacter jejuni]MCW1337918.1 phage tail protein [Campylobacter jejuni]
MVLALGEFEFKALNFDNLERSLEYNIRSQNRLNNHNALFASSKESEKIKIQGKTLPLKGDRNTYLDKLENMAKEQRSFILTGANGKYYGKFVILSLNENRSAFVDGSGFVAQSFSMDLERNFDE